MGAIPHSITRPSSPEPLCRRCLVAKIERDKNRERGEEPESERDIMLHHKERNLESVKDLIDPPPRATTSSPSSLSAGCTGAGIDSQPTQQMSVRDGGGEAADFTVSQSR